MQEIDRRIGSLKLRLAEVDARERALSALQQQYRQQLRRTVEMAVWSENPLDMALGVAGEVEGRLAETENTLKHLQAIRDRARDELHTLQLTKRVEDAKQHLAALERERLNLDEARHRHGASAALDAREAEVASEMRSLRRLIDEASEEAARRLMGA